MSFEKPPQAEAPDLDAERPGVTRRDFLKRVGRLAAGAAALSVVGSERTSESRMKERAAIYQWEAADTPEARRRDWQEFKAVLAEARVQENVAWIRERFGRAAVGILFKADWDLQLAATAMEREQEGKPIEPFLAELSRTYRRFWSRPAIEARIAERERREGLAAEFVGFEEIPGQSNEEVRQSLEAKFPKRWLYATIGRYEYVDQDERNAHFRVGGVASGRRLESALLKQDRATVHLFKGYAEADDLERGQILRHEIAHHHDWIGSTRLTLAERLQFLREVTEQLDDPQRLYSDYVEDDIPRKVRAEGGSEQEVRYSQAVEYWAECSSLYIHSDRYAKEPVAANSPGALAQRWYHRMAAEPEASRNG
ncbi:twin-arginine translocation signal domain-containing protein [Candidatus Parcubacteria bacterium]|nr:MAG: twin-arginine translocation signal domain-containing protein [Candidatus Parcubacteria bacterium]